jgi:hypothetical protein
MAKAGDQQRSVYEITSSKRRALHARLRELAALNPSPEVMHAALSLVEDSYQDGYADGWHAGTDLMPPEPEPEDAEQEYGAPTIVQLIESSVIAKHSGMTMTLRDEVGKRNVAVIRQGRDSGWVVQRGEVNEIHMPQAMAQKMKAGKN